MASESFTLHLQSLPSGYRLVGTKLEARTELGTVVEKNISERDIPYNRHSVELLTLTFIRVAQAKYQPFGIPVSSPHRILSFDSSSNPNLLDSFKHLRSEPSRRLSEKATKWIREMFSLPTDPGASVLESDRLKRWFQVTARDGGFVTCDTEQLDPNDIHVIVDEIEASPAKLDQLESSYSQLLDLGQSVTGSSRGIHLYGKPPTVMPEWLANEEDFKKLSDLYHGTTKSVTIVGDPMSGKTVFSCHWLRRLLGSKNCRHDKIFAWSFNRQGSDAYVPLPSLDLFESLAEMLEIKFKQRDTPLSKAATIADAAKGQRIVFFFDGCEANFPSSVASKADTASPFGRLLSLLCNDESSDHFLLTTSRLTLQFAFNTESRHRSEIELCFKSFGDESELFGSTRKNHLPAENPLSLHSNLELIRSFAPANEDFGSWLRNEAALTKPKNLKQHHSLPLSDDEKTLNDIFLRRIAGSNCDSLFRILCILQEPIDVEFLISVAVRIYCTEKHQHEWSNALKELVQLKALDQRSKRAERFSVHPQRRQYVREGMRLNSPSEWVEINRAIAEQYLSQVPGEHPDPKRREQVLSLCNAAIYLCQAGDHQRAYLDISYNRLAKKLKGHMINYVGEYEAPLTVTEALLLRPDIGAAASTLNREQEFFCIHVSAMCLRYLNRLDDAWSRENEAWDRARSLNSSFTLFPSGFHLMRLCHMYGRLDRATSVARKLFGTAIKNKVFKTDRSSFPPENLIDGASAISSTVSLTLIYRYGPKEAVRLFLNGGIRECRDRGAEFSVLMPAFGRPWHLLALLELGDWKSCEKAFKAKEFTTPIIRHTQTGAFDSLAARMFLDKANSQSGHSRISALANARSLVLSALEASTKGDHCWWQTFNHLVLGGIELASGLHQPAREQVALAKSIKPQSTHLELSLLGIDAQILEAQIWKREGKWQYAQEACTQALIRCKQHGYGLGRHRARKLQKLLSTPQTARETPSQV